MICRMFKKLHINSRELVAKKLTNKFTPKAISIEMTIPDPALAKAYLSASLI